MRFITFVDTGSERAGVLIGDGTGADDTVVDLGAASMRDALGGVRPQLADLITAGLDRIAASIERHGFADDARLSLKDVSLSAPIPRPRRIIGIAHNYRCALRERGMALPAAPVVFVKKPETVVGPGTAVVLPAGIGGVTYEAELAVVLGKRGSDIPVDQALSHVAAVGIMNDVSASEMIRKDGSFDRGKNLPTFGPFGPFLATLNEVGDLQHLKVRFEMDGLALQESNTSEMLFSVAELIAFLSKAGPLEVGDVIATGTPAGVAPLRKPPTWLRPGVMLCASVEGLGRLCNPVVEGAAFDG